MLKFNTNIDDIFLYFHESHRDIDLVFSFRIVIYHPSFLKCGNDGCVVFKNLKQSDGAGHYDSIHFSLKLHFLGRDDF